MGPYESLANAIVLLAAKDYRLALLRCNRHPERDIYIQEKEFIERFFRSGWFGILTSLDPEVLILRLSQEVA